MPSHKPGRPAFETFKRAVEEEGLLVPGDRVLAACSGGPDSVALLHLLLSLGAELPVEVLVAHFNHRLRPEADADEAFVAGLAERHGLRFVAGRADVRKFARERKLNLEEAGRRLRYDFLRRAARKLGATKIATGHTMNDQAETLLLRLVRGTGLRGLAGIAPVIHDDPCPVIRPLLRLTRPQVEEFLAAEGLEWRLDASNLDRRFIRNRVRSELLPELERNCGRRVVEHIARLADIVREEESLMDGFSREVSATLVSGSGKAGALDARVLGLLPAAMGRRVVREFIREVKGDLSGISYADVDRLLKLREGRETQVAGGLSFKREAGMVRPLCKKPALPRPFSMEWDGDGEVEVAAAGARFRGETFLNPGPAGLKFDDSRRAFFDRAALRFPLVIRNRRPGDRYRPFGAPGGKKVKELLRARGVARAERDRRPVFTSGGEIIWIPGLPAAEKAKVRPGTKRVFMVEKAQPGDEARPVGSPRKKEEKGLRRKTS
jgi:tRNA(Ile)-lysidine synthase